MGCFGKHFGAFAHSCGALEFVPVEGLAIDGTQQGFGQNKGEDLAVGKALQPDMEEQPAISLAGGVTALETEGD